MSHVKTNAWEYNKNRLLLGISWQPVEGFPV